MPIDLTRYNNDVVEIYKKLQPYFYLVTQETGVDKTKWINYLEVLAGSLKNIQNAIQADISSAKDFLDATGQHLSLENKLNDDYDPTSRRIYIEENNLSVGQLDTWYLDGEEDPENKVWYTDGESDPAPKDWYLDEDGATAYSFTVYIPLALQSEEDNIITTLNSYVSATKQYNIIYF